MTEQDGKVLSKACAALKAVVQEYGEPGKVYSFVVPWTKSWPGYGSPTLNVYTKDGKPHLTVGFKVVEDKPHCPFCGALGEDLYTGKAPCPLCGAW